MNEGLCNSKQEWNHDECRFKCKELDVWSSYRDGNPSACKGDCTKACNIDKCLDTKIVHVK